MSNSSSSSTLVDFFGSDVPNMLETVWAFSAKPLFAVAAVASIVVSVIMMLALGKGETKRIKFLYSVLPLALAGIISFMVAAYLIQKGVADGDITQVNPDMLLLLLALPSLVASYNLLAAVSGFLYLLFKTMNSGSGASSSSANQKNPSAWLLASVFSVYAVVGAFLNTHVLYSVSVGWGWIN